MGALFTSAARKAWTGAAVAFLGPLLTLLLATDQDLDWRSVVAAVVSGLVGGLGVYQTTNEPPTGERALGGGFAEGGQL